jgi:hypothetical protein
MKIRFKNGYAERIELDLAHDLVESGFSQTEFGLSGLVQEWLSSQFSSFGLN